MNGDIQTLIDLQREDSRIAALEADAARLPKQAAVVEAALMGAKKSMEALRVRFDQARKDLRVREKDLEVIASKRTKSEGRLYEVKTNKEYSAVLLEIEEIKQEKGEIEEKILALMETQERLTADIREAERLHAGREEEARRETARIREMLAGVEAELGAARAQREARTRGLAPALLGDYDRVRRARGGVAVASVGVTAICGGCRMAIRPQAIQELRAATSLMTCESCGRFLHWQE